MEISWFGHSCFFIRSQRVKILTDPFSPEIGLRLPKIKADIVTVSHQHPDHNFIQAVSSSKEEAPFVIDEPGEYEIEGVGLMGIASFHDHQKGNLRGKNTIFLYALEDLFLCHLGDLGHSLSDEQLEQLGQVDILFVPVGGKYTIDAKKATEVVNQIDPKIVIPMHYALKETAGLGLDSVEHFLKEAGAQPQPQEVLKITKNDLPAEERLFVVLESKT